MTAFEYEADLAALREELAAAKQLASAWKEQERLRGIQAINAGEALTAAEQRNSELEKLLIRCHNSDNLSQNCGLWKALDAAMIKPTESGEHK